MKKSIRNYKNQILEVFYKIKKNEYCLKTTKNNIGTPITEDPRIKYLNHNEYEYSRNFLLSIKIKYGRTKTLKLNSY